MNKLNVKKIAAVAASMICMSTSVISAYAFSAPVLVEENDRRVMSVAENIRGDVNGDGEANSNDIDAIVLHIKGKRKFSDISAADMNGDGVLNVTDITILAAIVKGLR